MSRSPVQAAFVDAECRLRALGREVNRQGEPLNAQFEAGEISEAAWAEGFAQLEERLGWNEAFHERNAVRAALLTWGLAQVRRLWSVHGRLFRGQDLAMVEALWTNPRVQGQLVRVVLRLDVGQ
ncbi:hypothetical protein [Deinococcus multiflagellatus]|uniref:hypothetical protein n=1 Tax=Deinococcus multiflagellatus TaxID=1656887 RepID=UPI001CCE8FC1|nr:hypothetical protein [Deinococcus multiflagellatus]MBZ9715375.1 hypothetical protein [Deinococcus multiflagellatus]